MSKGPLSGPSRLELPMSISLAETERFISFLRRAGAGEAGGFFGAPLLEHLVEQVTYCRDGNARISSQLRGYFMTYIALTWLLE